MNKRELAKMLESAGIEPNEAKSEAELILESILNKTREELLFDDNFEFDKIAPTVQKRVETRAPIQYILGFSEFMGEKFIVNENVLIPRDETEILVRKAFEAAKSYNKVKILDIGTGSGIIACILGKLLNKKAEILGVDISLEALNVAIDNRKRLLESGIVMFRKSDLFENVNEKFDIIVSNPPYIPKRMMNEIQKEVKFEPSLALYTEDYDGLYFYKKIIKNAKNFLNPHGYLMFEMMEGQSNEIKKLLEKEGFINIEITKDLGGIDRVITSTIF